jgi:hypothetical protein
MNGLVHVGKHPVNVAFWKDVALIWGAAAAIVVIVLVFK